MGKLKSIFFLFRTLARLISRCSETWVSSAAASHFHPVSVSHTGEIGFFFFLCVLIFPPATPPKKALRSHERGGRERRFCSLSLSLSHTHTHSISGICRRQTEEGGGGSVVGGALPPHRFLRSLSATAKPLHFLPLLPPGGIAGGESRLAISSSAATFLSLKGREDGGRGRGGRLFRNRSLGGGGGGEVPRGASFARGGWGVKKRLHYVYCSINLSPRGLLPAPQASECVWGWLPPPHPQPLFGSLGNAAPSRKEEWFFSAESVRRESPPPPSPTR